MNITDVDNTIELEEGDDMLDIIFKKQASLKERFDIVERKNNIHVPEAINIDSPRDQDYLKGLVYRIVSELVEATECLKNKPWKETHIPTDVEHFHEEIADALHFFIEFCLNVGIDADKMFQLYMKKNVVNNWRRDTKY